MRHRRSFAAGYPTAILQHWNQRSWCLMQITVNIQPRTYERDDFESRNEFRSHFLRNTSFCSIQQDESYFTIYRYIYRHEQRMKCCSIRGIINWTIAPLRTCYTLLYLQEIECLYCIDLIYWLKFRLNVILIVHSNVIILFQHLYSILMENN